MKDESITWFIGMRFHGTPEREKEFNRWYNEEHVPLVLGCKGVTAATRLRLVSGDENQPMYVASYQFKNRNAFEEYLANCEPSHRAERKKIWPDSVFEVKWRAAFEVIKTWK